MNQILATEKEKKNKNRGGVLEATTVVRIFAILFIVFGILLISNGVYSMVEAQNKKEEESSIPVVTMAQEGNKIKVSIKHDKAIDKIYYSWNEGQVQTLQGQGRNIIEEEIPVITGTNLLHLKIVDMFGNQSIYQKQYTIEEKDVISPEIELTEENGKIKITAKDETAIEYITYRWNEEDETEVDVRPDSPKIIEEKVAVLKGENRLKVTAVDLAGNKTEKEQTYIGAKKPVIKLAKDGQTLIITVTDEDNIQKIEYTLNGQTYSTDAQNTGASLNKKEFVIRQTLAPGENSVTVTAINVNGLKEEVSGTATI